MNNSLVSQLNWSLGQRRLTAAAAIAFLHSISIAQAPDNQQPAPAPSGPVPQQPAQSPSSPQPPEPGKQTPPNPTDSERKPDAPPAEEAQPAQVAPEPVALPEVEGMLARRVPQPGDPVVVVMKDGQRLEGTLIESDEAAIVVRIAAVNARIERGDLERVFVQDTPLSRYKRMRGMIAAGDTERRTLLAAWCMDQRLFDEALQELNLVLAVDPNHGEGLRLKALALELKALDKRAKPAGEDEDRRRNDEEARQFPTRPSPQEFPFLTPEQIGLIKVFEVDLRDPPRILIPRETVERMLTQYADSPLVPGDREGREAFLRLPAEKILDVMFRLRARELYPDVQVPDQPTSMKLFRDHVHAAWLVNNCATTRCHGGSAAGRLQLSNWRATSEESVYTNFLILERFKTEDGDSLINYEEAERSVLLQMGLPREDARTPHPAVPGWSPVFRTRENRRFKQALEWIGAMYRPRPDYPIEYVPPGDRKKELKPGEVAPAQGPVER